MGSNKTAKILKKYIKAKGEVFRTSNISSIESDIQTLDDKLLIGVFIDEFTKTNPEFNEDEFVDTIFPL